MIITGARRRPQWIVAECSGPECGNDVCATAEDRADVLANLATRECPTCGAPWVPVEPGTPG